MLSFTVKKQSDSLKEGDREGNTRVSLLPLGSTKQRKFSDEGGFCNS